MIATEERFNKRIAWRERRRKIMQNTQTGCYRVSSVGQISHAPRYNPCRQRLKEVE